MFRIDIRNVGRTKAIEVDRIFRYAIVSDSLSEKAIDSLDIWEKNEIGGVFLPDQLIAYYAWSNKPLSTQDSVDVLNNRKIMFMYGKITYTDIFDKRHFTRFCYIYTTKRGFIHFAKWNDAN